MHSGGHGIEHTSQGLVFNAQVHHYQSLSASPTRRLTYDFLGVSRASRVPLIPINSSQTLKKDTLLPRAKIQQIVIGGLVALLIHSFQLETWHDFRFLVESPH